MQFMILANDGWVNLPLSQQTSPPPPGLQPLPILLFPFLSLSFARWRRRKKPLVHSANQRHAHSSFEPTAHNRKEKRFPDHISVAGLRRIRSRMRRVCNPNAIYFKYLPFDAVPTSYQHTPPCHVHKSESINSGWMGLGYDKYS